MSTLIKIAVVNMACLFLALCFMTYQDYVKHPDDYRSTDTYYVQSQDKEGYYHARNGNGTILFSSDNVKGGDVYVGATVDISLDLAGRNPIVRAYKE